MNIVPEKLFQQNKEPTKPPNIAPQNKRLNDRRSDILEQKVEW